MTPRLFTEPEILHILAEGATGTVQHVCARHGISRQTFYRWRRKYGLPATERVEELRTLRVENDRLKRLNAQQALELALYRQRLKGGEQ